MSDADQTATLPEDAAPVPPPAYAVQVPATGLRFRDQVLGMRSVVAVALAMLIIGGLSGFVVGERTNDGGDRFGRGGFFMRGPGGFQGGQRVFPGGPQGLPGQPGQQPSFPAQPQSPR